MGQHYTTDWTTRHFPKWDELLGHLKGQPAQALELGSYEGRSAVWFLQNVLTHKDSSLICIDGWWNREIHRRFLLNIVDADVFDRCEARRGDTHGLLRGMRQRFDFIYIDADHKAPAILQDAILAWRNLKDGGILIFDDYLWTDQRHMPPAVGVDAFLATHVGQYEILHHDWQVILKKL